MLLQYGETGEQRKDVSDDNLQSLAPDFRKEIQAQLRNWEPSYNAHAGTSPILVFELSPGTDVLRVIAVLVDRLDALSGTRHWRDDADLCVYQDVRNGSRSTNAYCGDEEYREAVWKAIVSYRANRQGSTILSHDCVLDAEIFDENYAPPDPCPWVDLNMSYYWNFHVWVRCDVDLILGGKCFSVFFRAI